MSLPQLFAVGRVARAHGIRGRVLVIPYNEGSEGLERVRAMYLGERRVEVERAEHVHLGYIVALKGVNDRNAAEALKGQVVSVERSELPPLAEDELWAADLVGMQVVDGAGKDRGVVEDLEAAGPNELLRLTGGALVPMAFVKEVDEAGRKIVVQTPEGLFELFEAVPEGKAE